KRWWFRRRMAGLNHSIEKVARLQFVIPQEFIKRSMQIVRARPARCVDDRTIATELRGVCVCQRLKLGNRLNAERRSQSARAWTIVPEVNHILVIEKVCLSRRTSSCYRIFLPVSVERAARARSACWNLRHAWSKRYELCKVPPIERQFCNLF